MGWGTSADLDRSQDMSRTISPYRKERWDALEEPEEWGGEQELCLLNLRFSQRWFWDVTPCNPFLRVSACHLLSTGILLGLVSVPEVGGHMFLRNAS
jgi:hypothetical protein